MGVCVIMRGAMGQETQGRGDEATALVWGPPLAIVSLERNYPSIGY